MCVRVCVDVCEEQGEEGKGKYPGKINGYAPVEKNNSIGKASCIIFGFF